jgi:hypothetical protein
MGPILAVILIAIVGFGLIAAYILWLSNKITGIAVTDRFRDAEFIVDNHQAPAHWTQSRNVFARLMQHLRLDKIRKDARETEKRQDAEHKEKTRILHQLDDLILFFENALFFEDDHAKVILLEELTEARKDWENKSLAEIVTQATSD